MQMNDMILISIDDHVIEPPDAFKRHMPGHLRSRAPFVENKGGTDFWNFDGRSFFLGGLNAVAGRPREEYGIEPCSFEQFRASSYDVKARIDDMNANGVLAGLNFPSIVGFGGGLGCELEDKDYALAVIRAYNDWHIQDWAGGAPGRLIPLCVLPMWDIGLAVEEANRVAKYDVHTIAFSENPAYRGDLPSIHSDHWDSLWKTFCDNAMVPCLHIGSGAQPPFTTLEMEAAAWMTNIPMSTCFPASDWLYSGIWKKFPDLRVALSEAGIGWIPYMLERADFIYDHHKAWTRSDFGGKLPSEVFKEHFIVCFIDDKYGVKNRHEIGIRNITWECDFPHSDCTWPNSPEILWESLRDLPDDEINLITHENAMREFHFDPFKAVPREKATVGALRQAAAHIDTSPQRGLGGSRPGLGGTRPVTVGQMQAELVKQKQGLEEAA